jgi:SAM-dependent methyltransferase
VLDALGLTVRQDDVVLDLGCTMTVDLATQAAHVIAVHTRHEPLRHARALTNVTPIVGDGRTLAGVEDSSLDGAVADFRHIAHAKTTLGYVEELGRVLKPGAWAAFAVSTDQARAQRSAPSRRDLFRTLAGTRPAHPRGAPVPLDALGAVATAAGLTLERIEGSGTADTLVRATRSRAS